MIAWDTETRNFRWWENSAFLASWATGAGSAVAPFSPPDQAAKLTIALFDENDRTIVGANSKFDAHMTREATGLDVLDHKHGFTVHDVLMMSRLVFGNRRSSHGLKELAIDHIDPKAKDAEEKMAEKYHSISGRSNMDQDDSYYDVWSADPEGAKLVEKYAALDAEYTLGLVPVLKPQIDADPKLQALYALELRVQEVLYRAEQRGVRVDTQAVERLSDHYHVREDASRDALVRELGFVPEGEGSKEALREGLLRAGVQLTERTEKSGELAVNHKTLAPFRDHPAVAALFEWRRTQKFLTTYLAPLEGTELVHTTFKQAEAWTGRMACASPNLQNQPKRSETTKDENLKIRSVFVPRDGMEFIVSDFDSLEVRILAWFLGDPDYRKLIENGDPHAITAAAAWGGRPEDYFKTTPQRWLRDIAKHVTYGIVFGGGGPVVRDTINRMVADAGRPEYQVDLDQARAIRRKITGAIPGFGNLADTPWKGKSYPRGRLYEQLLASQDGDYGYVRTVGGRKQWISIDKAYVALSGVIQGSGADIMKAAAVNVFEALKPHGAYPLLFVHDELLVECERGQGAELVPIVQEAMESSFDLNPRLKIESHVTDRSYAHVG